MTKPLQDGRRPNAVYTHDSNFKWLIGDLCSSGFTQAFNYCCRGAVLVWHFLEGDVKHVGPISGTQLSLGGLHGRTKELPAQQGRGGHMVL